MVGEGGFKACPKQEPRPADAGEVRPFAGREASSIRRVRLSLWRVGGVECTQVAALVAER